MAAGNWTFYNQAVLKIGNNEIKAGDATAGAWKCLLLTSGYTPSLAHVTVADLTPGTYEAANYTRTSLTSVSWTQTSGVALFGADNVVITASGGDITAKYIVLFYDAGAATDADRELLCYADLETLGGSLTIGDGYTLTAQISLNDIFQIG